MSYENDRPIIGVLAQEVAYKLEEIYGEGTYDSYIAASYVKFLEGSGARVVPIRIGMGRDYYEDLLKKLNGVLLPGGATWFNQPNGYADAGEHIFNVARALNDAGDHFPLWGTCLGFQLLAYLWLNRRENDFRIDCQSFNQPSILRFTDGAEESDLFGSAPEDVITTLTTTDATFNYHRFCITEETFSKFGMQTEWSILSTSDDVNGLKYISSMKHSRYPFYGVQFHPEKNIYEWADSRAIPHSARAVKANRYFADFFVSECRKSRHNFESLDDERNHLIYNFPVTYTGAQSSSYEQCYFFKYDVPIDRKTKPQPITLE